MLDRNLVKYPEHPALLSDILSDFHVNGPINSSHLETLSILKHFHPNYFSVYESRLLYVMGMFYKVETPNTFLELIYDIYSESIEAETGRYFTPIQADAYSSINKYTNFSFSAPTSAGKSFLFQEIIKESVGDVIIVIPSRALLSEYLIKIKQIVPKSTLVLPFIELVNTKKTDKRIFIITPERGDELFKLLDKLNIQLFLFDEAQLSEEGIRGMKFDSFVRRVDRKLPHIKKVFTHPFVINPEAQLIKHGLSVENNFQSYKQNAVGKIFLEHEDDVFTYFSPYEDNTKKRIKYKGNIVHQILQNGGTCLIYISKTKIYNSSFIENYAQYLELCPEITDANALKYIKELEDYFGINNDKISLMIYLMKKGIVIHHGSIPLKARLIIEKFVNENHAKLCFSTSTLIQGINMPFDLVWVNNFRFTGNENKKNLDLKNLIGRAGRTTQTANMFDYGYVVVEKRNKQLFINRINTDASISETSLLDVESNIFDEDFLDVVDAIKNDTFDIELNLTNSQVERLKEPRLEKEVKYILDHLIDDKNNPLAGQQYYDLDKGIRDSIKVAFQNIYQFHLRRDSLEEGEKAVLSTAIPILLWQIQGKSFAEIVSLRHAFLSEKDYRRNLSKQLKEKKITDKEYSRLLKEKKIRFTCIAEALPNRKFQRGVPLFSNMSIVDIDFDLLIYDTYDYIDKVISLSLKNPLSGAFKLYYEKYNDPKALAISNYILYGTNNTLEIWLLKYGFTFEEIEWLTPYIEHINDEEISFKQNIEKLFKDENKKEVIERFL